MKPKIHITILGQDLRRPQRVYDPREINGRMYNGLISHLIDVENESKIEGINSRRHIPLKELEDDKTIGALIKQISQDISLPNYVWNVRASSNGIGKEEILKIDPDILLELPPGSPRNYNLAMMMRIAKYTTEQDEGARVILHRDNHKSYQRVNGRIFLFN
jgi:hypothetical protein